MLRPFHIYIMGSQPGFPQGCELLNALVSSLGSKAIVEELMRDCIKDCIGSISNESKSTDSLMKSTILSTISSRENFYIWKTLAFICRGCFTHNVSIDDLNGALHGYTDLSDECIESIVNVWSEIQESLIARTGLDNVNQLSKDQLLSHFHSPSIGMGVGNLVGIKWKIGVASKSRNCPTLSNPYVSLDLQIKKANTKSSTTTDSAIDTVSLELPITEFQSFLKTMKEVQMTMGRL